MYEQILNKVIEYLTDELEDDEVQVKEDSNLMDELGLSSLEVMILLTELKEEYHVKISDQYLRKMITVKDIAAIVSQLVEEK